MKKFRLTGEKLVNLMLFAFSVFYLVYGWSNYKIGKITNPKAGFLPLILGCTAVVITAFLTVQAFMDKGDAQNVKWHIDWLRFLGIIGVSLAYAFLMPYLGYILSSFMFLTLILKLAGVKGWLKPLLIAAVTALVFYLIFKTGLSVKLPAGILGW